MKPRLKVKDEVPDFRTKVLVPKVLSFVGLKSLGTLIKFGFKLVVSKLFN